MRELETRARRSEEGFGGVVASERRQIVCVVRRLVEVVVSRVVLKVVMRLDRWKRRDGRKHVFFLDFWGGTCPRLLSYPVPSSAPGGHSSTKGKTTRSQMLGQRRKNQHDSDWAINKHGPLNVSDTSLWDSRRGGEEQC